MTAGMAMLSGALLVFAQLQTDSSYFALLPGMLLGGVGMAIVMTPMTAAALSSVPVDKAGVGSGMLNTFRQVGGALGIAVMGAILAAGTNSALDSGASKVDAFMNGLHHALYVAIADRARRRRDRVRDDPQPRTQPHGSREQRVRESAAASRMSQPTQARLPAAERRAAIVAAALQVFGAGSYARSTTAEIARVAGVSEPIIYRHFPSKKELWFASLDEAWRQLRGEDRAQDRRPSTEDEAGGAGPAPRGPWSDPLLPHLWVQGVTEAGDDEEMQAYLRAHVREVHDFIAAGMRAGQAAGTVPADRDADAEAWIFLAGGLLRSFADRLGGLLGAARVRRDRPRAAALALREP